MQATVVEEAQRLDRHIQNLLDMTRLGQGRRLTLKCDWVEVHDIVSSAVERVSSTLKGLYIDINISPSTPVILVHGILIEQALVNLPGNAIRFSPVGGYIGITSSSDNEEVVIKLCDEGPGIPAEEREKVFDMFYTVHCGDRGNFRGTGLGLTICRGMVAAHSGTVTAQDENNGLGTSTDIRQVAYRVLFRHHIHNDTLQQIRELLHHELVLGRSYFKDRIKAITKRQTRLEQPGRPRVEEEEGVY